MLDLQNKKLLTLSKITTNTSATGIFMPVALFFELKHLLVFLTKRLTFGTIRAVKIKLYGGFLMKLNFKSEFSQLTVQPVYDSCGRDVVVDLKDKGLFDAKDGSYFPLLDQDGNGTIVFGLGEKGQPTYKLVNSFFELAKVLRKLNVYEFELVLPCDIKDDANLVMKALEGLAATEYKFDKYLTEKKETKEFTIHLAEDVKGEDVVDEYKVLSDSVNHVRDLVNLPPNDLYPEVLANHIVETFKDLPVEVEVFNVEQMKKLGMESLLAVGTGSDRDPYFVVMKYLPLGEDEEALALVGKGVTYDSGGYAIKPPSGMDTMKCDMAGAASVVGTIEALAKNGIQKNVVGTVGLVENLVSGHAYKNGDIIGSMKGTSIEVANTDAEGRLVLADAIYYAATKLNTKGIINIATLTGALIVSLGNYVNGVFTNNDELADIVVKAGRTVDEPSHKFEIFEPHREQVKGTVGDLKNSTTGGAGSITAAVFLEHFAEEKPWVHIDIAGAAFLDSAYKYWPAGATGNPVKTLYETAKNY